MQFHGHQRRDRCGREEMCDAYIFRFGARQSHERISSFYQVTLTKRGRLAWALEWVIHEAGSASAPCSTFVCGLSKSEESGLGWRQLA